MSCNAGLNLGIPDMGAMGMCTEPNGTCHCEWTSMASQTGGGGYVINGTSFSFQGKTFPYCVSGKTLTVDLSAAFVVPKSGAPFVFTATLQ
jgi:hypothetical protein